MPLLKAIQVASPFKIRWRIDIYSTLWGKLKAF